ncbi:hypothetical protein ACTFIZ_009626 [Dictyostelium cf. discoideum]
MKTTLILFLFYFIFLVKGINVISKNVYNKNVTTMGVDISYALYDIEFDEDLYRYSAIGCPLTDGFNVITFNNDTESTCLCDYTQSNAPTTNCAFPICLELGDYYKTEQWVNLKFGQITTNYTLKNITQFRFLNDKPNLGFTIKLTPIKGTFTLSILNGAMIGDGNGNGFKKDYFGFNSLESEILLNVCPKSDVLHHVGTYFLDISPITFEATFSIEINYQNIPTSIEGDTYTTNCVNIDSNHKCINMGDYSLESVDSLYSFDVKDPGFYLINFFSHDSTLFITDDPSITEPNHQNSKWIIKSYGSFNKFNSLTIYFENPTLLYLKMDCLNEYCEDYLGYSNSISIIKSQGLIIKPISSMGLLEASLALIQSSKIKTKSNQNFYCPKFSSCNPYSILSPIDEINPLWPVPGSLQFIPGFDYQIMENDLQDNFKLKEKSYQVALILSINYGKGIIEYLNLKDSLNIEIEFLSNLFNFDGDVIKLKIKDFNLKLIQECDYKEFKKSQEIINTGMNNIKDINNWKYKLGLLQSSSNWIGCENSILNYLKLENFETNVTSYQCPYSISDPLYQLDPCCNFHLLFSEACLKKTIKTQSLKIQDYESNKITNQCFGLDCTSIVLDQYITQKYSSSSFLEASSAGEAEDKCKIPKLQITNTFLNTYDALRKCRIEILEPPFCTFDDDCKSFNQGTRKCDLFTRKCIVNYEITDNDYIECVLNKIPLGTLYSLISTLDVNSTIINSIHNELKFKDWVIEGSYPKHSTYKYYIKGSDNSETGNLIDRSNEITYKTQNLLEGWLFEKIDYLTLLENREQVNCDAYFLMLPKGYNQNVYSEFYYRCLPTTKFTTSRSFCGYCTDVNSTLCHIYNGSLSHIGSPDIVYDEEIYPFSPTQDVTIDQATCELGLSMCLLADGSYIPNIYKDDCENQRGSCSEPCGYECQGLIEKCLWFKISETNSSDLMSPELCESVPGFQYIDIFCYTTLTNQQDCNDGGYTWIDCPSKDTDNCIGPTWNLTKPDEEDFLDHIRDLCYLKPIACTTKQECLSRGRCSDHQYFYNQIALDDEYPYPNGLGKCISNHTVDTTSIKSCKLYDEYDSPLGCYPKFNIPDKELCQQQQQQQQGVNTTKWWKPSTNKDECLSYMGCKVIDLVYKDSVDMLNPNNLPYNFRFNEMNENNCNEQHSLSGSATKWMNKFQWVDAVWLPGVFVQSKWYENKTFTTQYQYKDVLNYEKFYEKIVEATNKQVSVLYSSEAFCQKEKRENYLNSILCSCNVGGNSECFQSTNLIMAQSIVCNGEQTSISFFNGLLNFQNDSISHGCEMISISQISKTIYSFSTPQPLSNNFISYLKPDNFAILNSKDAIIGTLLNDGIILKSEFGFKNFLICMNFNITSLTNSKSYPIYDFAIKLSNNNNNNNNNNNESISDNKLIPLNSESKLKLINNINYYCSNIENITEEIKEIIIYPINRVSDWKDKDKQVLDKETTVLVYILACFFILVGIYGLFQTIEFLIETFKSKKPLQLTHLLIVSVSTFIIMRGIYFFVLPSGALTDVPSSDYVLVVLPTFIYLSSFSIIIALWYVIVFIVLKFNPSAGNMKKRLYTIVASVNSIIYLFFIAIVLVFQYTPYQPNTDCVGLIFEEMKNSTPQQVVSIVYSVVQALLSLLIGIAFIYLGGSIVKLMKTLISNSKGAAATYSSNQSKIKILTIILSVAFILHSIFIILISVKAVTSIIFTFIGLIITEIIPAISILYAFDKRFASSSSIKKSTSSSSSSSSSTKSNIHLNTVTTESGTESSEFYINKN